MKTLELITLRFLQGLSIALGTIVIVAIGYTLVQIVTGHVHGTASFGF
jgi:hypothetical protein